MPGGKIRDAHGEICNREGPVLCGNCGNEIKDDTEFCEACGAPVSGTAEQQAPDVEGPQEPAAAAPPEYQAPPVLPPPEQEQAYPGEFIGAPKRRISIPVMVALAVIVVALLATAITVPAVLLHGSSQKKAQKRACQANQRLVDAAIMEYAAMSPDESYPSSLEDLRREGVLESIPTCPSGNKPYIWVKSEIGRPPSISCPNDPDHAL
jgi:competence protein ComGC